jgi:hypothetical protein
MGKIAALLRILAVPVLVALLQLGMELAGSIDTWKPSIWPDALESFVGRSAFAMLLTVFIAIPFFKWRVRAGYDGYGTWLLGWLGVYALPLGSGLLGLLDYVPGYDMPRLLFSAWLVTTAWWWVFYADPVPPRNAGSGRRRVSRPG